MFVLYKIHMRKFFIFLTLLIFTAFSLPSQAYGQDNIFGLHLTQFSDLQSASGIINSSNGDWGWATIVIRLDLMDKNAWQNFFDQCRQQHIIPIVRIATIMDQDSWRRPQNSEMDQIASFLNSLNWPTQTQHVILFNEINHASEWGGEVDINSYVDSFVYTAQKLKSLNPNFFILGPGLDLASPEKVPEFKSAQNVYQEIYNYNPEYFNLIDGLASHSYPNHGYVGKPSDSGQHSIRGYQWELQYIKSLGIDKNYPVFITETGWPHRQGIKNNNGFYTATTTADLLTKAYEIWSKDPNIKAVTPFIYNYPYEPFDHFSWVDKSETLYPEYQVLVDMIKPKNTPSQITSYQLNHLKLPLLLLHNNEYQGRISLKNTGQSIWGETKFCLEPNVSANITTTEICFGGKNTPPNQSEEITFKFTINDTPADQSFIGWDNLPTTQIEPVILKGQLYRPKTGIKDKIMQTFQNIFQSFLVK